MYPIPLLDKLHFVLQSSYHISYFSIRQIANCTPNILTPISSPLEYQHKDKMQLNISCICLWTGEYINLVRTWLHGYKWYQCCWSGFLDSKQNGEQYFLFYIIDILPHSQKIRLVCLLILLIGQWQCSIYSEHCIRNGTIHWL